MIKDQSFRSYINKFFQSERFIKSMPDNFLEDIENKSIKINLKDIDFNFILKIENNSLKLMEDDVNHDVELIATSLTFLMFIMSKGSDRYSSKIIINGDIDTANKFNRFISSSKKIREVAYHLLGKRNTSLIEDNVNILLTSIKDIFSQSTTDVVDMLVEDLNIIPTKNEVNKYLDSVDELKSRTDQLLKKYNNAK